MRHSRPDARWCAIRTRCARRLHTTRPTTISRSALTNYVDYGPQNSRGFRALKVWLALRHVGAAGYRTMIADDIRLSRAMAEAVGRHAELQLLTQGLSITTFRYVPADLRTSVGRGAVERHLDALNRELLDRLQRGGEAFVSNAVIGGRYVLRACIVNFHTDRADVEALPEIVARVGRAWMPSCAPRSRSGSETERSPVFGLRSPVFGLRSSVSGLRSAVCGLRSAVSGLRSSVCSPDGTEDRSPKTVDHERPAGATERFRVQRAEYSAPTLPRRSGSTRP